MTSVLEDQQNDVQMADENLAVVRRAPLLKWLFGVSLVLLSAVLPTTAKASEHHHRAVRHHIRHEYSHHAYVRHTEHARLEHTAFHSYRHERHSVWHPRVVRAEYRYERRPETHEARYEHRHYEHHGAYLIRADYRYGRRHDTHEARYQYRHYEPHGAYLIRADDRYDRPRYRYADYRHIAARYSYSRLQCVPYAREISHIELTGNAFLWWAEAAGRYQRGHMPVIGAVLNFRSTGRMPLGHVAVVTAVLNSRTILVTQANWIPGTITNDVTVEDVSPQNNWSEVRVELDNTSTMGSVYPVYGFIYKTPPADMGTVIASNAGGRNEVAEAPVAAPIAAEAPDRNLR